MMSLSWYVIIFINIIVLNAVVEMTLRHTTRVCSSVVIQAIQANRYQSHNSGASLGGGV